MVRIYRLVGIFIFLTILLISYLLEISTKESKLEQFKVWNEESTLEVSDFLRRPPFYEGRFAARISYKYRIYDKPEVKVAVIIDRFNSYMHKHHVSDYLIRHEAYHVKLAQFFAKEINQSIKEKNLTFSETHQFLKERLQRDSQYQKMYDRETNHSLIEAQQNYWEYKIDSMLNQSQDFKMFQDNENINVYFPDKPQEFVLVHLDANYNGYKLEKYNVKFWIADLNILTKDTSAIEDIWLYTIAVEGYSDIIINSNYPHGRSIFESHSKDTIAKEIVLDKILLGKNTTYWLRNRYPMVEENEEIYKRMGDQFFNSFKVLDE